MKKLVFIAFVTLFSASTSLVVAQEAKYPQRLVSLSPHITELVFAAGAGKKLIAVDKYSDWPIEAKALPKIGDAFTLNVEYLSRLKPDLVLIWGSGTSTDKVSQIQRLGIPLAVLEPAGITSIADDIEKLGRMLGTTAIATKRAEKYKKEVEKLSAKYQNKTRVPLFYQIDEYPLYTVGRGHVISDAISLCGGNNIFESLAAIAPPVSKEAVIAKMPLLIIGTAKNAETQRRIRDSWSPLTFLPAVAKGNIRFVNPDFLGRAGPRFSLGISELCQAIDSVRSS